MSHYILYPHLCRARPPRALEQLYYLSHGKPEGFASEILEEGQAGAEARCRTAVRPAGGRALNDLPAVCNTAAVSDNRV